MRYLTLKEFDKEVRKILDTEVPIGSTDQHEIRFKTHEIMRLAGITVDLTKDD